MSFPPELLQLLQQMQGQQGQQQQLQQWKVKPGAKRARAERVARHMSYQLIDEMVNRNRTLKYLLDLEIPEKSM